MGGRIALILNMVANGNVHFPDDDDRHDEHGDDEDFEDDQEENEDAE
jgi:hypothetical protein